MHTAERHRSPPLCSTRLIRRAWIALALLMASVALTDSVRAQDFPSKALRIIVPFPAGSSADVSARQVAQLLSGRFGQPVVVDNKPGANGVLAAQLAAQAAPDGYTLLNITSHMFAVTPHLVKKPGFDALNDFVPVMITGRGPALMVVSAQSRYKSVADLLAAAKQAPGTLSYGSSGEGSAQHIMGESLKHAAGVDLLHVPYKGETPALLDVIGGRIDVAFGFPAGTLPHLQSGKLRALALTGDRRVPGFPGVPPLAEAGVPGYAEVTMAGYVVPRGTPAPIVRKLNDALREAVQALRAEFDKRGAEVIASTPEVAASLLRNEHARMGRLVRDLGLQPQ